MERRASELNQEGTAAAAMFTEDNDRNSAYPGTTRKAAQ